MSWDSPLARPIELVDGRILTTLREAAEGLIASFGGVSYWPALEYASELLHIAAETGDDGDIAAATHQVAVVFHAARLSPVIWPATWRVMM
jgi:hypothetical protein